MNITGSLWFRPNTLSSGGNLSQFVWADGNIFAITEAERTETMDSLQLLDTNTMKNYRLNFNASKNWTGVLFVNVNIYV